MVQRRLIIRYLVVSAWNDDNTPKHYVKESVNFVHPDDERDDKDSKRATASAIRELESMLRSNPSRYTRVEYDRVTVR